MRLRDLTYCCADCGKEKTAKDMRSGFECSCGSLELYSVKSFEEKERRGNEDKVPANKRGRRNKRRGKR